METKTLILSAFIRAVRTFVQVMLGVLATNVANVTDVETARAIALAAVAAGFAAAWRAFIDPRPIPSLVDPAPATSDEGPDVGHELEDSRRLGRPPGL